MFTRLSAADYDGGSRVATVYAPYTALVALLGEPHHSTDADYPDDNYKTDVCWSVRSTDDPRAIVSIWNYKNGPAYNGGEGSVEDIDHFSAYYTDKAFFERLCAALRTPAQAGEEMGP